MKIITVFVAIILLVPVSFSSEIYVDADSPNDPGQGTQADPFRAIAQAVSNAEDHDVIIIAPGTYTGPQNRDIDTDGINISFRSTDPNDAATVDSTVIDCGFQATGDHRAFVIQSGETGVVIEGLTITDANAPPLDDLDIRLGGAIAVANGANVTIKKCNLTSNASNFGGAIGCFDASVTVSDCRITENSTYDGGNGGAIYVLAGDLTVNRCLINDNFSDWQGGAIATNLSRVRIQNSEIQNNIARIDGGALELLEDDAAITNCLITNNTVTTSGNGGGINCSSATAVMRVTNCTIAANSAEYGGGIAILAGDAIVSNTLIGENSAPNGSQIALRIDSTPSSIAITYSDIQFGLTGIYEDGGDVTYDSSNIDIEPMFASFDLAADPSTWDFHLMSKSGRYLGGAWVKDSQSSPCLGAGDPAADWSKEPWPNGKRANMGAYANTVQASMNGNIADLNIDGQVNETDLKYIAQSWLSEPDEYEDLNNDKIVNLKDFAIMAQNWLLQ
ncbi:MAG: hypothetical protein FVQ82_12490 [Planctomycetes bacterium]|nr:hypothetical protein [Planctomycetota bacterium]